MSKGLFHNGEATDQGVFLWDTGGYRAKKGCEVLPYRAFFAGAEGADEPGLRDHEPYYNPLFYKGFSFFLSLSYAKEGGLFPYTMPYNFRHTCYIFKKF